MLSSAFVCSHDPSVHFMGHRHGYCWPKMMTGPINGPMAYSPFKFHNLNGTFEILMGILKINLMGKIILYIHILEQTK